MLKREEASRKNLKTAAALAELLDEQSPGLLKELHLLTRDGNLNADARRKLKQVNHLYGLLKPALEDLFQKYDNPLIVDVGAGKAYLGFVLYELCLKNRDGGRIVGVEERGELVTKAAETARRLGFGRMTFEGRSIQEFAKDFAAHGNGASPDAATTGEGRAGSSAQTSRVHLMTALHACDTATDDALAFGIRTGAEYIAVIPCCQAETAKLLKELKDPGVAELWRHGIHRREFGSHVTNVLRALTLEAKGYSVTVTELVGWEHSLKNEFILARKTQVKNPMAEKNLRALLDKIQVRPQIVREFFS